MSFKYIQFCSPLSAFSVICLAPKSRLHKHNLTNKLSKNTSMVICVCVASWNKLSHATAKVSGSHTHIPVYCGKGLQQSFVPKTQSKTKCKVESKRKLLLSTAYSLIYLKRSHSKCASAKVNLTKCAAEALQQTISSEKCCVWRIEVQHVASLWCKYLLRDQWKSNLAFMCINCWWLVRWSLQ